MPPRTVDDLGIETYTRYAQDRASVDEKLIRESRHIPFDAEKDVTLPSFASEFDSLLETNRRNQTWAGFFAPPLYHTQKKRLYSFLILPSLGTREKRENQAKRIKEKAEQDSKSAALKAPESWEEERACEEEKREKEALLSLLHIISSLESDYLDINSRRHQYQKG